MTTIYKRFSMLFLCMLMAVFAGCSSTEERVAKHESPGEYVSDAVITSKVKANILAEASLKSSEINVETYRGTVQLSGFVSTPADIHRAVEVTRNVEGVKSVKNDMRLK
jgi:osmotically-inducible protein OsmY